ncbi:helix-turn-helix transcriptional regulator [Leucobacter viscericola]|uniref:Helix-turn-helix transcriptional regulator n=1 Tax=Leucobacter viscericola TaxID=2714935 RepID=A0A6G7XBX1_9MICO|nr:TetR family transcriptional regulator [Leucobacter viscericola]QIK61868.1 helix-turn-helix transcriptional regulator [Leucobacter viscericola]
MSSRRPRRRPGENRELLIEAGLVEFGLFGYQGASTGAIALRADVPQPHVYANFANKQELFLACFQRASAHASDPEASVDPAFSVFLYQAVAAVNDPLLVHLLPSSVAALKRELGDPRFNELLVDGALELLRATDI